MAFGKNYWSKIKSWASALPLVGRTLGLAGITSEELLLLPPPRKPDDVPGTKQYEEHPSTSYMELKMAFRDIGRMNAIGETLGRDFLTAMPEGAYKSRLGQIAFLYRRMHEELAHEKISGWIDEANVHQKKNSTVGIHGTRPICGRWKTPIATLLWSIRT